MYPARHILPEIVVFAAAFLVSLAVIVILRRYWTWPRGLDAGDGVRKLQRQPVLRVGGIALYFAFILSFAFSPQMEDVELKGSLAAPGFFALGTAIFLLGLLDDLFGLSPLLRLMVQISVGIIAHHLGFRIDILTHPFGAEAIDTREFGLFLTILWFVAIPNLINLVDGMDGLAGGISLFLFLTLASLGAFSGNLELLTFSIAMSGGIIAFLIYNLPPARIYMGDGGAYLLGFVIAGASLSSSNKGSIFGSLLVVVIVLGFPILDTALAMIRRALSGLPLTRPDALHLHHRLLTLGISKRNIIFALYGIFAGLSLLGLSVFLSAGYSLPIVGMIATIGTIFGLRYLGLPHNLTEARATFRDVISARKDVRYAYSMCQVLEHELERAPSAEVYWTRFDESLARLSLAPVPPGELPRTCDLTRILILRIDDTTFWALRCPRTVGKSRRWERVVRCFFPVVSGARTLWPDECPPRLGFHSFESPEDLQAEFVRLGADPPPAPLEPALGWVEKASATPDQGPESGPGSRTGPIAPNFSGD